MREAAAGFLQKRTESRKWRPAPGATGAGTNRSNRCSDVTDSWGHGCGEGLRRSPGITIASLGSAGTAVTQRHFLLHGGGMEGWRDGGWNAGGGSFPAFTSVRTTPGVMAQLLSPGAFLYP